MKLLVKASAAVALVVATSVALPAVPAHAAQSTNNVALTCSGDPGVQGKVGVDELTSQQVLDLLGSFGNPPQQPPVTLALAAEVTSDVPSELAIGASGNATFTGTTQLPQSLIDTAQAQGITSIDVKNIAVKMDLTGPGTANPPLSANPPDTTINLANPVPPAIGPFSSSITGNAKGVIQYVLSEIKFSFFVTVPALQLDVQAGVICTIATGSSGLVNQTSVGGAETTTTTATTLPTTTTAAPTTTTAAPASTAYAVSGQTSYAG